MPSKCGVQKPHAAAAGKCSFGLGSERRRGERTQQAVDVASHQFGELLLPHAIKPPDPEPGVSVLEAGTHPQDRHQLLSLPAVTMVRA